MLKQKSRAEKQIIVIIYDYISLSFMIIDLKESSINFSKQQLNQKLTVNLMFLTDFMIFQPKHQSLA